MRALPRQITLDVAAAPFLAAALACTSCASEEPAPAGPGVTISDRAITAATGNFRVPGGADLFECFYTSTITERELATRGAMAVQGEGGHHLALYYTMAHMPPQHHPCDDAEMANWNIVAVAGSEAGGGDDQTLPEGLATRIPPGAQLVIQAHYINARPEEIEVADVLDVEVVDPVSVAAYANQFVLNHEGFDVAARSRVEATYVCRAPQDLQIAMFMGHMHQSGVHFRLERLPETGDVGEVMYEHDWESAYVSHPPVVKYTMDAPLTIPAGTRFRQRCLWDNTSDTPLAFPTEMCITAMWYFPDTGGGQLFCERESATQTTP
jgi:hypothetical protein